MKRVFKLFLYILGIFILGYLTLGSLRHIVGFELYDCGGGLVCVVPAPTIYFFYFWGTFGVVNWLVYRWAFSHNNFEVGPVITKVHIPWGKRIVFFLFCIAQIGYYFFALYGPRPLSCSLVFDGPIEKNKDSCLTEYIRERKIDFDEGQKICRGLSSELYVDICMHYLARRYPEKAPEVCPTLKSQSDRDFCFKQSQQVRN